MERFCEQECVLNVKSPKILIVTNSINRSIDLVERSLNASLKQNYENLKVFFVDQNSTPLKLNEFISQNNNFLHIKTEAKAVSKARNSFQIPKDTDWIIFCDDDGYMKEDYLSKFISIIKSNPQLEIIAGSIVRDDNFEFYSPRHKIGGSLKKFKNTKLLMGSNFAVKKDTFILLSGFDESFGAGAFWGSGEETDFAWKAFFKNIPMEFFPELVVYHIKPYAGDFIDSIKKAWRYGRGKGALVAKWLIFNSKLKVLYELIEMQFIPLIQILISIIKFKFLDIPIYIAVFFSRIFGLLEYIHLNVLLDSKKNES